MKQTHTSRTTKAYKVTVLWSNGCWHTMTMTQRQGLYISSKHQESITLLF